MVFFERQSHLFSSIMSTFQQMVFYQSVDSKEVVSIPAVKTMVDVIEISGTTRKIRSKLLIKASDVVIPKYRDKVTIDSQEWHVEKVFHTSNPDYFELDIRRDEKLIYG